MPETPQNIYNFCKDNNYSVEVLVNNAGYGIPSQFHKTSMEDEEKSIRVLSTSVIALSKAFIPDMLEKKSSINPIYAYKIQNVTVLLNKLFEEYENAKKELIVAIMSSTTLTNGESSGQSSLIDSVGMLDDIIDINSKLIINFTSSKIKVATKIQVINSDSIDELTADAQKKKQLWASIKKILNL